MLASDMLDAPQHSARGVVSRIDAIRWFTLDCLCLQSDDPLARAVFNAMLSLRITAYHARFTQSYLPVSTIDFIARHHVFCVDHDGGLRALAATMQISLATCDHFGVGFPAIERCRTNGTEAHRRAVEALVERHRADGAQPLYWGRYCKLPTIGSGDALSSALREMFVAAVVDDHVAARTAWSIGLGHERVLPVYEQIGFRRIAVDGAPLAPLPPAAGGLPLPTLCMEMDRPTEWALACRDRQANRISRRTLLCRQDRRTVVQ
jgi:hypothetical protein